MLIVFEGIDGSGTTTQAEILANKLKKKGLDVFKTSEPTENKIGLLTREILQNKWQTSPSALQLLFCADRADHLEKQINPALKKGKIVITDRYFYSTIAFGSLACSKKWLENICQIFPLADIIFYLKLDSQIALERIVKRGEKELFEKKEFLEKVSLNFEKLFSNKQQKTKFFTLDAKVDTDFLADKVWLILKDLI